MASLFRNRFSRPAAPRRRRLRAAAPAMPFERLEPRLALAGDTFSRPMLERAAALVMDASIGPNPVVMSKSQVVGNDVKSFVISHVPEGSVVEKWDVATESWIDVSTKPTSSNPQELMRLLGRRVIQQGDKIQWRPKAGFEGAAQQAFQMINWDDGSKLLARSAAAPQAVRNLAATLTGANELTVSWDAPVSDDPSGYTYTVTMTTTTATGATTQTLVTSSKSVSYPGLSARNGYSFSVAASNEAGTGVVTPAFFGRSPIGEETIVLDGASGQPIELMASHLLGRNTQGFTVTQVYSGTLERWSADQNAWLSIPSAAMAMDAASLQNPPAIRNLAFYDLVRWTPSSGDVGAVPAFDIIPLAVAGGVTAPTPVPGTVPGRIINPQIQFAAATGTTLTWAAPADGCGCASTRYSIELTREDGRVLLYNVASDVHELSVDGRVLRAELWGATKTGAGAMRYYDALLEQFIKDQINYNIATSFSGMPLRMEARTQLSYSPTTIDEPKSSFALGGSQENLAQVAVYSLPNDVDASQGLTSGSLLPLVSTESNKLTPDQIAKLADNPTLAQNLFPGTVDGQVQPDQMRVYFQPGEKLRFAGTVDASVRDRATIVIEHAPTLVDNSLGHWDELSRITIGEDGRFAYDHLVQYGMTAVRVRLELLKPQAQTATPTEPTAPSTPIPLPYNAFGITTHPWQVANHQGFDRNGNYYNSYYNGGETSAPIDGTPITDGSIEFPIGPIPTSKHQVGGSSGPSNFVQAKGQTIEVNVDAERSDYLYLAGAAANGNQLSQQFILTFTDGTQETWTQSFTDWSNNGSDSAPQPFSGEWLLLTQPERINQQGNLVDTPAYVFAYGYHLRGRQLASITLPNNENVGILSAVVTKAPTIAIDRVDSVILGQMNLTGVDMMQLTIRNESNIGVGGGPLTFYFTDNPVSGSTATDTQPATYTTAQVTVQMGQQKTITYVGPDSASQMSFYVQKADGTCVGKNCSTYLTDWKNGSGDNKDWAANISPSLNTQMTSGQSWTMTIQNAGEGYWGYLDSPAGQNLPDAHGDTPAGAQFKLLTEAEIKAQPPWALAVEEFVGTLVGVAIITVATGGVVDFVVADAEVTDVVVDGASEGASAAVEAGDAGGDTVTERWLTDSFMDEATGTGEGGVFFSDDISVISDDVDSVLEGTWSELDAEFEGELEVDPGLADQQQIIQATNAEERMNKAVAKAFFGGGLF